MPVVFPAKAQACSVFLDNQTVSAGWSETYYADVATPDAAVAPLLTLIAARRACLVDTYRVVGYRISDTAVTGDSIVSSDVSLGLIPSLTSPAADLWTALLFGVKVGNNYRGRKFLHGIPRDCFGNDLDFLPLSTNGPSFVSFGNLLKAGAWGLRHRSRPPTVPVLTFDAISNFGPLKIVEHRVGRPFGLLVGRRKT